MKDGNGELRLEDREAYYKRRRQLDRAQNALFIMYTVLTMLTGAALFKFVERLLG